jgi:tetratricopeptide (TPR) repeat protein
MKETLDAADRLLKQNQLEEADSLYCAVLAQQPSHLGALLRRGIILRRQGKREQALTHFKTVLQDHPLQPPVLLEIASELCELGQFDEAERHYQEILSQDPKHFGALHGLALNAQKRGDRVAALKYFRKALSLQPDHATLPLEIATELRELGRPDKAEAMLRQLVDRLPDSAPGWIHLAQAVRRRGDRAAALKYYRRALLLQPDHATLPIKVATELRELGRPDKAEAMLRQLVDRLPDSAQGWNHLAKLARRRGDRAAALEYYRRAFSLQPDHATLPLEIASELRELGRLDEAEAMLRQLVDRLPDSAPGWIHLAQVVRRRGDRAAALKYFRRAFSLQPDHATLPLEIASELSELGQFGEAQAMLQDAQSQFPEHSAPYVQQGLLHRQQQHHAQALACFQQALANQPHDPQIRLHIATEYFALGQVRSAVEQIQQVLDKEPTHHAALMQCGNWLMAARIHVAAQHYFRQAMAAHPWQLQPYLQLAQCYLELGESEQCFATLDRATQILGEQAAIFHKKAQIQWQTCHIEAALATQAMGLIRFPDHYPLQVQALQFQIELGGYAAAERTLSALPAQTLSQQLTVRLRAAQILKEQWRLTEARQHYGAILAEYPQCLEARRALLLISLLAMDIKTAREQAYLVGQHNLGGQKITGRTRSYLHDHYAQLMDEYELNQPVLQQCQSALSLPTEQRLQAISQVVLEDSDATAAAVTFLVELRQAGYFGVDKGCAIAGNGKTQSIPKNIFQYWDKSNPPKEVLNFTQSWQRHHPDYAYRRLDERQAREFLRQHYSETVLRGYLRCQHAAQKADVLRLALLACHGGIYADADDYCLQAMDALLAGNTQLVLWQEPMGTVGNNFIAVTAGHPVIAHALEQATEALIRGDNDSIWLSTGPGLLSRSLALYLASQWPARPPSELGVQVLTKPELMRFIAIHGKLAYKSTQDSWLIKEFTRNNRIRLDELLKAGGTL